MTKITVENQSGKQNNFKKEKEYLCRCCGKKPGFRIYNIFYSYHVKQKEMGSFQKILHVTLSRIARFMIN